VASFLDTKFSWVLDLPQFAELRAAALKEIVLQLNVNNAAPQSELSTGLSSSQTETDTTTSKYANLVEQLKANSTQATPQSSAELELRWYQDNLKPNRDVDPLQFWTKNSQVAPLVSQLALDILAIPATTAPIERVFSHCGLCVSGKNSLKNDETLYRELKIRVNRHLME